MPQLRIRVGMLQAPRHQHRLRPTGFIAPADFAKAKGVRLEGVVEFE